ncbi:MAG: FimB/Mfa2 family fimbrial subunit [Bacteroidales bacterium]|nr:FimB/Mfa2 family fimbrial subunit [Bacteroidales bacterium]
MKQPFYICAVSLLIMELSSCEKANFMFDDEEGTQTTTSSKGKSVNVSLRSASNTSIEYPVLIYAFDEVGICRASAVIADDTENATTLKLPQGTYRLTAISLPDSYSFTDGDMSRSSPLQMPACGYARTPFSTGNADIIVTSSTSQSVSIRMGYRQSAVNVTLINTPANITAMDVSLSTPYSTMSLDGIYADVRSVTVPCVKSGDSWKTETFYIMPTRPSQTVLTMHLSFDDGSSESYSYTYNATLEAGVPYFFTGNYAGGVSEADITASIQGGEWEKPVVTDFDFGPGVTGITDNNETTWYLSSLPAAGDVLYGHVVAISNEISSEESGLLLISLDEWSNVYSMANEEKGPETAALIDRYIENGLKGWRLPTEEEAKELHTLYSDDAALAALNAVIANAGGVDLSKNKSSGSGYLRYLCGSGRTTFTFAKTGSILNAGTTVTYNMRLVKSITAKLKQ